MYNSSRVINQCERYTLSSTSRIIIVLILSEYEETMESEHMPWSPSTIVRPCFPFLYRRYQPLPLQNTLCIWLAPTKHHLALVQTSIFPTAMVSLPLNILPTQSQHGRSCYHTISAPANLTSFEHHNYPQIKHTAIGNNMTPSYGNLYMAHLDRPSEFHISQTFKMASLYKWHFLNPLEKKFCRTTWVINA